jgi:type IV secretion system protein VirB10
MTIRTLAAALISVLPVWAQDAAPAQAGAAPDEPAGLTERTAPEEPAAPAERSYLVDIGTRIPLSMVNSVSTKHSQPGDRVYLETSFPIAVNGKIVIPAGSYVMGTITSTQRPGKVKGRGEFYLRFDSLMLPNGVTRDFRGRVANLDGRASEGLDKDEGVITSEGNKAGDAQKIGETAAWGASLGGLATIGRGPGMGVGIGAAAGATGALIGVLLTRGPDAVLAKGTTVEMVLDRQGLYSESELDFSNVPPRYNGGDGSGPLPSVKTQQGTRRFP